MKLLLVGDPHITVEELEDGENLIRLVREVADKTEPDFVVFLGDLHHNHASVRIEVTDFWRRALKSIQHKTILLVGNHDRSHDSSVKAHALQAYSDLAEYVVDTNMVWNETGKHQILFLPYIHDNDEFVKQCRMFPDTKTVICHQSFNGAKFENGFYDPHGVDRSLIPQPFVFSGHIHARQSLGEGTPATIYVGSPRWRTASDANAYKAIDLVEFELGYPKKVTSFSTETHCKKIIQVRGTEEDGVNLPDIHGPAEIILDLDGSEQWMAQTVQNWAKAGVRCRTTIRKAKTAAVKESEGISLAMDKYLDTYPTKRNTPNEVLKTMAKERILL